MATRKMFSGIQPSGLLHLGNYLGAINQWTQMQHEFDESIFCIVDLHAITVPQDRQALQHNILSLAATYLAAGIDPEKATIFVQSARPEHTELAWVLNCISTLGELKRMTQFKDKAGENQEKVSVGLFDYPVLMAADILLYNTTHVPVGEDQKQHVELTRDLAERFNARYGNIFTIPEPVIKKETARIMGLDDPTKKMSKSASTALNFIALNDSPDEIRNKFRRAVTDSGNEIRMSQEKPAINNLLNIFSEVANTTIRDLEAHYPGKQYSEFKSDLAEAVISYLTPFQEKYQTYISDRGQLVSLLQQGAQKLEETARTNISKVYRAVGLGIDV